MNPETVSELTFNLAQLLTAVFGGFLLGYFCALCVTGWFLPPRDDAH